MNRDEKLDVIAIAIQRGLIEIDFSTGIVKLTEKGKTHLTNLRKDGVQ
jgi:hypothetical protein